MTAKIKAALFALAVAALAVGFMALRAYYIGVGEAQEKARQDAQTVQALSSLIDSHAGLIQAANLASMGMTDAMNARRQADDHSTRSFKNALQKTAGNRSGCLFDADSLRYLDEARARAAGAAASGLRGAAPTPAGTLGRHP